ncbi:uncharacterized protein LAESUDRAFT_385352 [Laetiporus sulphureus 93-53]|uniref:Uncharacterized protein n=1 Tax=Laetiporus sulphureus 93-53 TaxID=1314785 RepID=A0A165CN38_9APHY|nr:uncharacterized protein LAESUDRAFT_385352 [Laetiporus sulphureus 93-53]KZT03112.1 hypothetical protein LAESUDRAFT_385352 [Laetiporus sulphureus 93-53]
MVALSLTHSLAAYCLLCPHQLSVRRDYMNHAHVKRSSCWGLATLGSVRFRIVSDLESRPNHCTTQAYLNTTTQLKSRDLLSVDQDPCAYLQARAFSPQHSVLQSARDLPRLPWRHQDALSLLSRRRRLYRRQSRISTCREVCAAPCRLKLASSSRTNCSRV